MARAKPKETAKAKGKGKRRAPTPDYNDSAKDDDDNELDVDFLTTDPNSPFVNMDLIVSPAISIITKIESSPWFI